MKLKDKDHIVHLVHLTIVEKSAIKKCVVKELHLCLTTQI